MQQSPIDRIEAFCLDKGIGNLTELGRLIGASAGTFSIIKKRNSAPGTKVMTMLVNKFPDLSAEWVLYGKGTMYHNDQRLTPATQLPAPLPSHFEEPQGPRYTQPFMMVEPDLSGLSPQQQAEFWRARWEKAARQLADMAAAREQEELVQLVKQAGGRSFSEASAEAAEPTEAPLMTAHTNHEYVEAQEADRVRVAGFGRGR